MQHEFCINCGQKNVFEISKPKFCSGCGEPFNTTVASRHIRKQEQEQENDDGDGFDVSSIDIDKLRKQIGIESFARKVSLDDLWSSPTPTDRSRRPAVSSPQGEALLQAIKKDCAPTQRARDIDE